MQGPAKAPGRGQRQQQAEYRREQGAQGGHGNGFQGAVTDGLQMARAQVGAEKTLGISTHPVQVAAAAELAEVDAQVDE
ncbi:hypothetical protein D3C85_1677540 [compost metagenome]